MTRESLTCEMRVLLISGGLDDPTSLAWARELRRSGVPFDEVSPTADDPLDPAVLTSLGSADVGRYNGVVLGTDSSAFWGGLDCLDEYRERFGVRQVAGFEFPREAAGLQAGVGRPLGGTSAVLTSAGREVFNYLRGPVPIDAGAYGYPAKPATGDFTVLLAHEEEALVGLHRHGALEDIVMTLNYADNMLHWLLMVRGLVNWVTRERHFGVRRDHLSCHIDDIFLANWLAPSGEADDGELPTVRMTGADVAAVVDWQLRHDFTLDLAYNGHGADTSGADELTGALLAERHRFRWINHTWSHLHLGRVGEPAAGEHWRSVEEICAEVTRNVHWARDVGVDVSPTALITGAHSGLDHPHLAVALERTGVTAIASDASVESEQRQLGPSLTVPRYPTNVYTGASTWEEQLGQYTERYGADAPGADSPVAFLEAESRIVLQHVLSNDPRPTFAHQSNLTRDRLILTLLQHVLTLFRSYLDDSCRLVSPTLDEAAVELARQGRWRDAVDKGEVSGRAGADEIIVTSAVDIDVPITAPAGTVEDRRQWLRRRPFGELGAGTCSGWHPLRAGEPLRLLPRGA